MVCSLHAELDDLLRRKEFPLELSDRLQACSEDEARNLIRAWRSMTCRNASLVEYCPVLSASLGCNTAPLMLGGGETAKVAGLYMCKYLVKDAYELTACLSVLVDAREHIDQYPSTAQEDTRDDRTSKHFLQRVLNASATELSPTQAAAIVLGMPSSGHSHSYVNSYVWDAVDLVTILKGTASSSCDALSSEHDNAGDEPNIEDAAEEVDDSVRQGTCNIYTAQGGTSIAVTQAQHYAHRSFALEDMNFDEFVMIMQIVKKPEDTVTLDEQASAKIGRPQNPVFAFLPPHPLASNYVIKQKAKPDVPILVGKPPPRLPPHLQHASGERNTAARQKDA